MCRGVKCCDKVGELMPGEAGGKQESGASESEKRKRRVEVVEDDKKESTFDKEEE